MKLWRPDREAVSAQQVISANTTGQGRRPTVHIIADEAHKFMPMRAALRDHYDITEMLLRSGASALVANDDLVIVAADLRQVENISALKPIVPCLEGARRRLFVIHQSSRIAIAQACAFGATNVLSYPARERDLLSALAEREGTGIPADMIDAVHAIEPAQESAKFGAAALASMFAAVAGRGAIDLGAAKNAGSRIADSIKDDGLSNWLDTVRRHHEGTYQHCLLVTGVAIDFGLSLGIGRIDLERLYSAAMFHDIGKASIPAAILDKPGRLDPDERATIETHPAIGYSALKDVPGMSDEILDAVRHHHELLDGSGYPDRLSGIEIKDLVRILTIADIFAALIENRRYKPPMSRQQAYDIIRGMTGKLEAALVGAFAATALNR